MKQRLQLGLALAAILFAAAYGPACADEVQTTFALTVNPITGRHEVNGNRSDKLNFAPLPLGELTLRRNAESLRIEGLPPVAFGYGSSGDGAQATQLSIVNATLRHAFAGGWFVGAGQTVYNQFTTYSPVHGNFFYTRGFQVDPINGSEAQYSRVTGARFEAGRIVEHGRDRVEAWVAVNPHMRGIQYTRIPTFIYDCPGGIAQLVAVASCRQRINTFADPENAAQVDLSARIAHRTGKRGEILYGVRYLNYSAHYDDFPGQLADRNVGFAPLLGYRIRL